MLKGTAFLGSGTKLSNAGTIVFGNKFAISGNTTIICGNRIEFGESDLISWDCLFMDTDLHDIVGLDGEKKNTGYGLVAAVPLQKEPLLKVIMLWRPIVDCMENVTCKTAV